MVVFQLRDMKSLKLIEELSILDIKGFALNPRFAILNPFKLLLLLMKRKKIKVYIFRYLNDTNSFSLAIVRYLSDLLMIFILKVFNIKIWWLCHNVDKETHEFHPKVTKLRRNIVSKHSEVIFTTNELLMNKAKEIFPDNTIDFISLGYIDGGIHFLDVDTKSQYEIEKWIQERKSTKSKFIFCIGYPALKSLHFSHVSDFITSLNENSEIQWYCIVVGGEVEKNKYIYNIPFKSVLDKNFIKKYADYFYRIINDYSMSYSTYEAVNFKIPLITENFGILPAIIEKYKIGIVVNSYSNAAKKIEYYNIKDAEFERFEKENNWKVAANKINEHLL